MATLFTMSILTPGQCWIIAYSRGDCVEDISHFLFEDILVNQWALRVFSISAETACVEESALCSIFLMKMQEIK